MVVTFYTNPAKTKTNTAGLSLTTIRPAYGQMKIVYGGEAEEIDKNLSTIGAKSNIEALMRQFAATLPGIYTVVPNNYFLPTGCELHSVEGGIDYILQ